MLAVTLRHAQTQSRVKVESMSRLARRFNEATPKTQIYTLALALALALALSLLLSLTTFTGNVTASRL